MTQKKQTTCDGCGKNKKLSAVKQHHLCTDCKKIADTLENHPEVLQNIGHLINIPCQPKMVAKSSLDLPDVLDAVRFRTKDREMNTWYVSVSELEGDPVEIFASTAFDRDHQLQSRISNLTTITRLISLILRHIYLHEKLTLKKVLGQLQKSSRQKNDLPDMLARVLENYKKHNEPEPVDADTPY